MASSKINLDDFQEAIEAALEGYGGDVAEAVAEAVPDIARQTAAKLRAASRSQFGSGKYARGWTFQTQPGRLTVSAVVYGKSGTYQLAHLLEYGHVTRNGTGRTYPRTPAHPHIAEVSDWVEQQAPEIIERTVKGL